MPVNILHWGYWQSSMKTADRNTNTPSGKRHCFWIFKWHRNTHTHRTRNITDLVKQNYKHCICMTGYHLVRKSDLLHLLSIFFLTSNINFTACFRDTESYLRAFMLFHQAAVFKTPYNVYLHFLICSYKSYFDSNIQQCPCTSWIIFCIFVD